ncbi:hypothetical protein GCM10010331_70610 [Streptomyces xanthochromogenes]|uniref:acylneuraminate cytidylyltransferase family protein n=1 Tax=Streptomyces xanthochromogenes TaxID=67384 RepID=UPI00167B0D45|nr:cytidylyltransferase [Streptomyces xanthochromogenes]GHB72355.1 hypothetical protein GCM10010331_70610 [Streptomyces xanthochromogenes]
MHPALLIGRGGSRGLPRKNTSKVLDRPMMVYPLLAAQHSKKIDEVYLSTDDAEIAAIGRSFGATIIDRPAALATSDALVEDVVVHGHQEIIKRRGCVEIFALLLCNSATITPGIIDRGIGMLEDDPTLDSALTVSRYNEYSPVRARRIDGSGLIQPFVDVNAIPGASCDRDSQGDVYFCDGSAWILRERCTNLAVGQLPFRWTGNKMAPLFQTGGLDIDNPDGVARTEWWLREHGFTETSTPYDLMQAIGGTGQGTADSPSMRGE